MPLSPGWAKNVCRRVLGAALERDLSKADRKAMERHFSARCAHCGQDLGLKWHADHLASSGANHISNRVPACPTCNEHEKRDRHWLEFLTDKCGGDESLLVERRDRIIAWRDRHVGDCVPISDAERQIWIEECARVAAAIDSAHQRLRAMRATRGKTSDLVNHG